VKLIELHVSNSGSPITFNSDAIVSIGILHDTDGKAFSTFVHSVDGLTVEVSEDYVAVRKLWESALAG